MDLPHEAVLLRIFTGMADRWHMGPLYLAVIEKARERHLAGATVLRGVVGFGQSGQLHQERALPLRPDQPVVVEIVDTEEKIDAFLPVLDGDDGKRPGDNGEGRHIAVWPSARRPAHAPQADPWTLAQRDSALTG